MKAERFRKEYKYFEAVKYYKNALRKEASVEILMGLADVYRMVGNFKESVSLYGKCIKISKMLDDEQLYIDGLVGYGMAKRGMGEYDEAYRYLNLANMLYEEFSDEYSGAFCKWCIAGYYRIKGNLKESLEYFKMSLSIFRKNRIREGEAYALCGMGGTLRIMGDFKKSLLNYKRANEIFKKIRDKFGLAYSSCGMGSAYRMLGRYDESSKYYNIAAKIYESIHDKIDYAYVLWGFGNTLIAQGKLEDAAGYNKMTTDMFRKVDDKRGLVYGLLQLGEICRLVDKKHNAIICFKNAFKVSADLGLKLEVIHAKLGLFLCGAIKSNPIKEYNKFNTKWVSVLKRINQVLNFP